MTGEPVRLLRNQAARRERDSGRGGVRGTGAAGAAVWSTAGKFESTSKARQNHLAVAAANWHALATFAGRLAPHGAALLIDIGSTSTDAIPLHDGVPATRGLTDRDRLQSRELIYLGVRRTPVFAIVPDRVCAELFATTQDAFVILGLLPEDAADCDTANGQPLTRENCLTRLAHVKGADREELSDAAIVAFAEELHERMVQLVAKAAKHACPNPETAIVTGAGEFLARHAIAAAFPNVLIVSLNDALGPAVSACAPAYALTQILHLQPGL